MMGRFKSLGRIGLALVEFLQDLHTPWMGICPRGKIVQITMKQNDTFVVDMLFLGSLSLKPMEGGILRRYRWNRCIVLIKQRRRRREH